MFHAKNAESAKFLAQHTTLALEESQASLRQERRGVMENCLHARAEIYGKGELEEEDDGEAVLEFAVHGLVVPYFHAEPCPYASAHDSKEEQGGFGYAPTALPGLEFVNTIGKEGYGIYCKQVIYDNQMYVHLTTI